MIHVAILGAGIGKLHLDGFRALPNRFNVAAVCDLDTERAEMLREAGEDFKVLSDVAEVMADPEINLIDICLPPHLHVDIAIQALKAGKDVICEKPLGRSLAEVDRLRAAIDQFGGQVFPVFQYRYGLATAQLAALQAAGLTGRALVASAETHWNREGDYYATPWRGTWKGESGGALLGHAIHAHDLLCNLFGPVAQVSAMTDTLVNDIEVEDCATVSMRMENGALASSSVTLGAAPDTSRLKLCFAGLTAQSGSLPYAPAQDTWTFTARGDTLQSDVDRVVQSVPETLGGFAGFLDAVADAMSGAGGREVTFEDGRRSIELVTALYTSAREGRLVRLPIDAHDPLYGGWTPA